jgi:hypothetical protein
MAKTVGDFLFERLKVWGARRISGYPGSRSRRARRMIAEIERAARP